MIAQKGSWLISFSHSIVDTKNRRWIEAIETFCPDLLLWLNYYNYSNWFHDHVSPLNRFLIALVCKPKEMANQDIYEASQIDYLISHC